jgi:hypothetical protein
MSFWSCLNLDFFSQNNIIVDGKKLTTESICKRDIDSHFFRPQISLFNSNKKEVHFFMNKNI